MQPGSADTGTLLPRLLCTRHHQTISEETLAPSLRHCNCHRPDETQVGAKGSMYTVHGSPYTHVVSGVSQGTCWTLFQPHCFPRQVARNWHYPREIAGHEGKDVMEKMLKLQGNSRTGNATRLKDKRQSGGTRVCRVGEVRNLPTHGFQGPGKSDPESSLCLYLTPLKKRGIRNKREKRKVEVNLKDLRFTHAFHQGGEG